MILCKVPTSVNKPMYVFMHLFVIVVVVIFAVDFAENRLKIAEILYFKILENVMAQEMKRLQGKDMTVSM